MAETKETPTPAEASAAQSALIASLLKGQSPQARGVTAPDDQRFVAWFDDKNQLHFDDNPNYNKDSVKTTVYGSAETGYFKLDNNGNAQVVMNPNPDALVGKAVDRYEKENAIKNRQANEASTGYYMTDVERAAREQQLRQAGLDQQRINLELQKFGQDQKHQDATDAASIAKTKQDIAQSQAQVGLIGAQTTKTGAETQLTGAQTQKTGAETGYVGAQTAALQAKTPAEVAEANARAALATQQAADLVRKGQQPTVVQPGEGSTITTVTPEGKIVETPRQGYVPKTLAEVQARVGQMQQAAAAKTAELQAKIGADYSADQADKDFKTWYGQNIAPQQQALQSAQEEVMYTRAQEEAKQRVTAYNAAANMGTLQVNAYNAQAPRRLGEGAQGMINQSLNAINKAGGLPNVDYSSLVTRQPDLQMQSEQAVNRTLAALSPAAARAAGAPPPNFAGANIPGALDATQWMPSATPGAPAPAAPPPAATGAAAAPAGGLPTNDWFAEWQQRQAADAALQRQQAQAMPPPQPAPIPPPGGMTPPGGGNYSYPVAPWNYTPDMMPNYFS